MVWCGDMVQKVFVGLSGGVDSGVSAAILKEQGYDVVRVLIKIWQPEFIECTSREARLDAMRVAAALSIPFREIDLSEEYKREVVDSMVHDYERGITPNPDVLCNEKIKFGAFARWAFANGADLIATGHYARTEYASQTCVSRRVRKSDLRISHLLRGLDPQKDQSYFLYRIQEDDLARTLFPIGAMLKSEVRKRARGFGLPVADKSDSQGLCFVGDVSMRDFLARFIKLEKGRVLDENGEVVGEHDGAALYTIGQRHGFTSRNFTGSPGLPKFEKSDFSTDFSNLGPRYVIATSIHHNTITVSPNRRLAGVREVRLRGVHWIVEEPPMPLIAHAQSRYRETPFPVTITQTTDGTDAAFDAPRLVSSGQSLVMYEGERVLGGGIIERKKM